MTTKPKYDLSTATITAQGVPTVKPTPEEDRHLRNGIAFLVVKSQFFAHLLYHEMTINYTRFFPTAATDGRAMFFNPDFMKTLSIPEVAFVIAHEVSHGFLGDLLLAQRWQEDGFIICPAGQLPYEHDLMNRAEDYRINGMLTESKIGKMPQVGLFDQNISAKGFESSVEIYEKLYERGDGGQGYGTAEGKQGQGKGGFDVHLAPSKRAAKDAASGKRDQAIAAAAAAAQASGQGTIPGAVLRLLGDILEPKVSWQDHLRSTCIRKGGDPFYDWRYLDRRLLGRPDPLYFARQAHSGAGTIVIAGDTSGSIGDEQLRVFFSEMSGICADLNPQQVIVMWCDAHVHRVDDLDEPEDLLEYKGVLDNDGGPGGGGGTSFVPVFEKIEELGIQPDMLVYFTDTYGTFPDHEPDYPVVWGVIVENGKDRVPWGEVVHVEV